MFESEQNWREKRHLQMTEREIADVTDNCPNHISNEKKRFFRFNNKTADRVC